MLQRRASLFCLAALTLLAGIASAQKKKPASKEDLPPPPPGHEYLFDKQDNLLGYIGPKGVLYSLTKLPLGVLTPAEEARAGYVRYLPPVKAGPKEPERRAAEENRPKEEPKARPKEGEKPGEPAAEARPTLAGVIVNKSSRAFHRPTCNSAKLISPKNLGWCETPERAKRLGYDACERCKGIVGDVRPILLEKFAGKDPPPVLQ